MNQSLFVGGAVLLLLVLAELAVLNHLLGLRKSRRLLEASLSAVFQKRADLIPWLLVTAAEHESLPSALKSEIISLRAAGFLEPDLSRLFASQIKLAALIDHLCAQGKKTPGLRADIDFLTIRKKWADYRREVGRLTAEREAAITAYEQLKHRWYALPIRPLF